MQCLQLGGKDACLLARNLLLLLNGAQLIAYCRQLGCLFSIGLQKRRMLGVPVGEVVFGPS